MVNNKQLKLIKHYKVQKSRYLQTKNIKNSIAPTFPGNALCLERFSSLLEPDDTLEICWRISALFCLKSKIKFYKGF